MSAMAFAGSSGQIGASADPGGTPPVPGRGLLRSPERDRLEIHVAAETNRRPLAGPLANGTQADSLCPPDPQGHLRDR